MPHAFAIAHGLDWDTEIASFWTWLEDAREVLERGTTPSSLVQDLISGQKDRIEEWASRQPDPESARRLLTVAIALVGVQWSTTQKLLNGLKEAGVFDQAQRERPVFDTIH